MMHSDGYRELTRKLLAAADKLCNGRLVFTHEGGYSRWAVRSTAWPSWKKFQDTKPTSQTRSSIGTAPWGGRNWWHTR
jgi:acetoin utilization deacetylase AcuC-like enzyme